MYVLICCVELHICRLGFSRSHRVSVEHCILKCDIHRFNVQKRLLCELVTALLPLITGDQVSPGEIKIDITET